MCTLSSDIYPDSLMWFPTVRKAKLFLQYPNCGVVRVSLSEAVITQVLISKCCYSVTSVQNNTGDPFCALMGKQRALSSVSIAMRAKLGLNWLGLTFHCLDKITSQNSPQLFPSTVFFLCRHLKIWFKKTNWENGSWECVWPQNLESETCTEKFWNCK